MPNLDSDYDRVLLSLNRYAFGAGLTINSQEECKVIKKSSELSINYINPYNKLLYYFQAYF